MPKKAETAKKKATQIEVASQLDVSAGHYANHIQVVMQEEEFVLDFLARTGDKAVHVARVYVSPLHAQRLLALLKRQIAQHKKAFPRSPLHKRATNARARRKA
ncbi:MAG: DUF3467 domain-containing protein [Phycisphaerae bacterium]